MNYQKSLTLAIIKYMLSIFGFNHLQTDNVSGIVFDNFKKKNIVIDYEDENSVSIPIYSAITNINNSKIQVEAISIGQNDGFEFCAVFKCDDLQIYGLKYTSDENDLPIFLISKNDETWTKPSMFQIISACAGLELLNDSGITWKPEPVGDFLHKRLLEVVEM